MARSPRRDLIDPAEAGVYHCVQRAVRRAWLCGQDPVTGESFDHRKVWIQGRLAFLAGQFAIDICSITMMSNTSIWCSETGPTSRASRATRRWHAAGGTCFLELNPIRAPDCRDAGNELVDWTGRQTRPDKRGPIPADLSPILRRLSPETGVETVLNFGRWFRLAAGRVDRLAAEAGRRGRRWLQGVSHSRAAFA